MLILLVAFIITVADQLTKQAIRYSFTLNESRPIIDGFFELTYVRNTGAAWGMFQGQGVALIALSIVMLILMVVYRRSFVGDGWEHRLAYGLLIGGIIGNLLDRVRLRAVTDFLQFYIGDYPWPAFNIADSAICIGVGIYIITSFWMQTHPLHEAVSAGTPDESA